MDPYIPTTIVWNGFSFKWKRHPHRLSVLGSRILHAFSNASERIIASQHEWQVRIGNFPRDQADYSIPYTSVLSKEIIVGKGSTDPIVLSSKIENLARTVNKIRVKADKLYFDNKLRNVPKYAKTKVLLNGFTINSANNRAGWHFGGLGILLSDAKWADDDTIEFTVELTARPARSPEPFTHGNRGWNYSMDCEYEVTVDYLILFGDESNLNTTDAQVDYFTEKPIIDFRKVVNTGIPAVSDFNNAFVGISGFQFMVDTHNKALRKSRSGRYIREMGFFVRNLQYDPQNGSANCEAGMIFSNDSGTFINAAAKWTLQSTIHLSLIQYNGHGEIKEGMISGRTKPHSVVDKRYFQFNLD